MIKTYKSLPQAFTHHSCLRKTIHPLLGTTRSHSSCEQGIILPQTLQIPPEPQRKQTQFDKSCASALDRIFAWQLQLQIPLHLLNNRIFIAREGTFKKQNDKPHVGTHWHDSVTQVLNRDVSAQSPQLLFPGFTLLPTTTVCFCMAHFSLLPLFVSLNSEKTACGVGTWHLEQKAVSLPGPNTVCQLWLVSSAAHHVPHSAVAGYTTKEHAL